MFENVPGPFVDIYGYCAFALAGLAGMRRGEILPLRWGKINFDEKNILIDEAIKIERPTLELGLPKWGRVRTAILPDIVADSLKQLRTQSMYVLPDNHILVWEDGTLRGGTWWQKRFRTAMVNAGFVVKVKEKGKKAVYENKRGLRPHSFRHSLQTIFADASADPLKVRNALGWAGPEIQANYTHAEAMSYDALRQVVDDIFAVKIKES